MSPGRAALVALGAVTVLRLAVAAWTPLSPDEAYYWLWSRALAPGYLDHPPMVALWIRAGTELLGPSRLGVRLLGPLSAAAGTLLLYQAGRDLLGDREAALRACVLLNATLLLGAGSVTMTPDTPLLLFWIATLWAMARLIGSGRQGWWLVAGVAAGLGFDSKYTAALLPLGILLWLGWSRRMAELRRPAPWLAALLGLLLVAPVLWWNAAHGWVSFAKQGGRGAVFQLARAPAHLLELLLGQAALATPLLLILLCAGSLVAARRALAVREARVSLLAALVVPPALVFLEHALGDRVQPNWPAVIYPAAALAAVLAPARWWRALYGPGVVLGGAMTAAVYVQSVAAPWRLSPHLDPTLRLSGGYGALARGMAARAAAGREGFIAADSYGAAALLDFLVPGCFPVVAIEPRWGFFRLPAATGLEGTAGLLLRSDRRRTPPDGADWSGLGPAGEMTRARDGVAAERYRLYAGVLRAGGVAAVRLPCREVTGR